MKKNMKNWVRERTCKSHMIKLSACILKNFILLWRTT